MANNRMYIRCKTCGNILMLGKCYLDGYYLTNNSIMHDLNDFYDKHAYCSEPINKESIEYIDTPFKSEDNYFNRFEIAYELEYDKDE